MLKARYALRYVLRIVASDITNNGAFIRDFIIESGGVHSPFSAGSINGNIFTPNTLSDPSTGTMGTIDITNNNIVVPFSANNGPDFTITTNGQYRVDVVQLDGSGNPIAGACVFSTPNIGIRDRAFQVDVETTPSNCNAQGTIKSFSCSIL